MQVAICNGAITEKWIAYEPKAAKSLMSVTEGALTCYISLIFDATDSMVSRYSLIYLIPHSSRMFKQESHTPSAKSSDRSNKDLTKLASNF